MFSIKNGEIRDTNYELRVKSVVRRSSLVTRHSSLDLTVLVIRALGMIVGKLVRDGGAIGAPTQSAPQRGIL